ncbi:hypothetical protein [Novosphingobium sp. UBA1939]|jgi:hypothetical protein|uniref:hypothetical protein n=1 Tax=Novosphingobium sp. UBA1939 TaxID=1946982 RepID=UPI0025DF38FA|nr:hypothetical protein [Novosphingobium sp. UBA1939]
MTGMSAHPIWHETVIPEGPRVNLRYIDWIWHVRGSVPLPEGQTAGEALDRIEPVFDEVGTAHVRSDAALSFTKKNPASQDPLSVFERGVLRVEGTAPEGRLRYHLVSRALLACFLAPLLFLGFAQLTILVNAYQKPAAEAAAKKPDAKKADAPPMHPIDKALGAPEPEKPGKNGAEGGKRNRKPTPTPAYVFAGIFAALYVGGRILEDRLVKRLFRKRLLQA